MNGAEWPEGEGRARGRVGGRGQGQGEGRWARGSSPAFSLSLGHSSNGEKDGKAEINHDSCNSWLLLWKAKPESETRPFRLTIIGIFTSFSSRF